MNFYSCQSTEVLWRQPGHVPKGQQAYIWGFVLEAFFSSTADMEHRAGMRMDTHTHTHTKKKKEK